MKIHIKSPTCFIAELSAQELKDCELSFDESGQDEFKTERLIELIIDTAVSQYHINSFAGGKTLVEALPVCGESCFFLCTHIEKKKERYRLISKPLRLSFKTSDIDNLLDMMSAVKRNNIHLLSYSLFKDSKNYFLVAEYRFVDEKHLLRIFSEFGEVKICTHYDFSVINEYAELLYREN